MTHVNGKEMIFGTWFTILHEGSAVVDLPYLPGFSIEFEIMPWKGDAPQNPKEKTQRMTWEQNITFNIVDKKLHFVAPYLMEIKSHPNTFYFDFGGPQKVMGHLIRQQVMGAMIVHIAMYLERGENAV